MWTVLDSALLPDGTELQLRASGGLFEIRVGGRELMTNRAHGSEAALAELGCAGLMAHPAPRVLVGGLGMGFTLRSALDRLPASAVVVVAELVPAVAAWNRGPLAGVAGRPLADKRVALHIGDVAEALTPPIDAILLDVDNGPGALTLAANGGLYTAAGLDRLHAGLGPRGRLAVWSADPDPGFEARLTAAGFAVETVTVPARGAGGGPEHTVFLATRTA